jgi:hypothetical protein
MIRRILAAVIPWTLASAALAADAVVSVERNEADSATAEYKFSTIASPSRTDAACSAKIGILSGQVDANSGRSRRLIDGVGARSKDDPENNFFFTAGRSTRPRRLLMTLSGPTDIQAIHTYSWHPDVRGPQVYTVFGDGGNDTVEVPKSAEQEPAAAGWKKIAAVNTSTTVNEVGGQYAVRIAGPQGSLGQHQRLLFDIRTTSDNSPSASTFFSEIDVLDGKEHQPPPAAASEIDWFDIGDRYRIGFDTSEAPDLKPWVDAKLKPVCATWYPKIVELLPSENYAAPEKFTITFREEMDGVAFCSGTSINCAARWYRTQLEKEALGSVVHEMVHVVQQYPRSRNAEKPGWLVEGLADYVRWHRYEPASARRRLNPQTVKYTDSYHVTGAFLAYVADQKGTDVITKLNAALRNGTYTANTWKELAGAPIEELWAEFVKTLKPKE